MPVPIGSFRTGIGSFRTGNQSVLTAGEIPCDDGPCDCTPALVENDTSLFWFKADAGTHNQAGQTGNPNEGHIWDDQWPNHWNVTNTLSNGDPIYGPIWTPNVINGLPGYFYEDTGPGTAVGAFNYHAGLAPIPTVADAPKTIFALVMRTGNYGGQVLSTYGGALQFGHWDGAGPRIGFCGGSFNKTTLNAGGVTLRPLVLEWRYTSSTLVQMFVNGVDQELTANACEPESFGSPGFSIGNVPVYGFQPPGPASRGFQGFITEVFARSGVGLSTDIADRTYLLQRAGLISL